MYSIYQYHTSQYHGDNKVSEHKNSSAVIYNQLMEYFLPHKIAMHIRLCRFVSINIFLHTYILCFLRIHPSGYLSLLLLRCSRSSRSIIYVCWRKFQCPRPDKPLMMRNNQQIYIVHTHTHCTYDRCYTHHISFNRPNMPRANRLRHRRNLLNRLKTFLITLEYIRYEKYIY